VATARRTAAAALCAGLLAGCGGSSRASDDRATTTAPAGGSLAAALPPGLAQKSACGLVTQAEVEGAIGARVGPAKEQAQESRSLCTFSLASTPDQSVVLISTTSSGVPAFFTTARERATSPQSVSAGEEAFVSGAQGLVRRGNTMVAIIVVLRQGPPQLTAAATKLVQAAGNRI
jgi:hypothetical protein